MLTLLAMPNPMVMPIDVTGVNLLKEERPGVVTSSSPSEERLPGSLRADRPVRRTWPSGGVGLRR